MKLKNFWLRTLNIRQDEGWLVKKLFFLQFLQGSGIAFFFTASFALFLGHFEITQLPYVFIFSSFLLWITGFIYGRLEHKMHITGLAIVITIFMAISILLFRLAFVFVSTGKFLYIMLAWFYVLYLLNNLAFWGIASLLFDARQSKRLFGVISAGDLPAKFIGYTLALLFVDYIGTINLLWAGSLCMFASIPFLISLKKSGRLIAGHHQVKPSLKHAPQKVGKAVKKFSENIMIRRLAILSVIITGSFIILNFAFYAGIKEEYSTDLELARFIAFFLAIVRIVALGIKMVATSRLINKLGIIKSLSITPVVMLLLISTILLMQNIAGYQKVIIYFFGLTSMLVDVLRSAINTPVFLTLMQPLSSHERLRAHTIVKGVMDPFAFLFAGIMLLVFIHYQHKADLISLCYILLAISVCWIIGVYRVNTQYLKMIIRTLSNRYFNREDFAINDSGTLNWLKEKVRKGSETEIYNILNMLYKSSNSVADEVVIMALQHPSEKVQSVALNLIQQKNMPVSSDYLLSLLDTQKSPMVIAETVRVLSKNVVDNKMLFAYLDSREPEIQQAALAGLLNYGDEQTHSTIIGRLKDMMISDQASERRKVAVVLGEQNKCGHIDMILQLMQDENIDVRKAGFLAAGKSCNDVLLKEVIDKINTDAKEVIEPLFIAGEASLPIIESFVKANKSNTVQKLKLILLCGRIGGEKAQKLLLVFLYTIPEEYMAIIKALYRCNYPPSKKQHHIFIAIAQNLLKHAARIIYMQTRLQQHGQKYQLLLNSFNLELIDLRETLLYIFAIMYDRENINKVRSAYSTGKKESIINAMEILDISVRKDLAGNFNTMFEPGNITERMNSLSNIYPDELFENADQVLSCILKEEKKPYHYWTTACTLYSSKKFQQDIDRALIKKYTEVDNLMVRETALYAL